MRPPQAADAARWREYGWRAEPDLAAAVAEHEALREILEGAGAEVIVTEGERGNPDAIYAYDPLLVGERGAVLLRPGKSERLGEAGALEDDLAEAGIPIAGRIEAPGTIDGGDTLWLDHETLLVGRGYRTNACGGRAACAPLPRRRRALLRSAALERTRRGDAPDEPDLPARRRPGARLPAARARAADGAPARARDRRRRGPGRGVRDDGPERARARPATCARAGRERRDAPPDGGGRRRGAHVPRRRDLAQGRRRPDVPDATSLASMKIFELIDAGDADALRDELDLDPELAGTRNADELSPVLYALYHGKSELVEPLLDANPPLDVFDAAAVGRTRGLEELLDGEPELITAWSKDGFTPLHLAAFFGQEDAAKILLERGAEVNLVARHASIHVTPLHSAAAGSHPGIVKLLLEHGADPNAAQDGGFTPLHSAAGNDDKESVEALLEAGADPSLANDEGQTPADLAGDETRDLVAQSH